MAKATHHWISNDFIHSSCVSKWYTRDGSRVPHLLKGIKGEIGSVTGDKGYDQNAVYKAIRNKSEKAKVIIHPRSNAVISGNHKWTQRIGIFTEYKPMGCMSGEENRGTINKAKWRTHFIGIKQY